MQSSRVSATRSLNTVYTIFCVLSTHLIAYRIQYILCQGNSFDTRNYSRTYISCQLIIHDQHFIDSIHPFLQIASAVLDDKTFLVTHSAEFVSCNFLNAHSFISPIVMPCS